MARPPKIVARVQHWGAPTGGWNSLDNITQMAPEDAVQLDNMFPEPTYVRLRRGSLPYHNQGGTAPVRSLMTYASASGEEMYAAMANTSIVRVSNGYAQTGFGGDLWQYVNFSTPGGQYIVAVNGVDALQWYNNGGNTWTNTSNTWGPSGAAPPTSNFSSIASYAQRLFFAGDQTLYLYYLPVTVLQGEIHGIDCGQFLPRGGKIVALGTWTRDNSFSGMTDMLVVITDMGEALTFSGLNPDDPSNWTMGGRFEIGEPPAGHRQLVRMGPDMMLICEDGFQSLANYLAMGQSKALVTQISRKIGNAVSAAIKAAKGQFGWDAILYPENNALLVNVPQPTGVMYQYVVNTITGAWCRFIGLQAYCWTYFQDALYFGTDNGIVMQADIGDNDNGTPINFELVTSFQMLGDVPNQKRATMCRPFMQIIGQVQPVLDVNVDYNIAAVTSPVATETSGAEWNTVDWNEFNWASAPAVVRDWYSVGGLGTAFSVHMSGQSKAAVLQLLAFDIAYEPGFGFV